MRRHRFIFDFPKTKSGDSIIITAFEAVLRIVPTCLGGLSQVAAAWKGFPAQRTSWCSLEWGYRCLFDRDEEFVATPVEWLLWLVDLLVWLEDLPVFTVIWPVDLLFSLLSQMLDWLADLLVPIVTIIVLNCHKTHSNCCKRGTPYHYYYTFDDH